MAGEATGTGALTGTLVAAAGLTGSAESTSVLDARLHDGTNRVLPPLSRTAQALVEIPDRTAVEAIVRARISYVEVTAREALADYSPHTPIVRIAA